ncbi:MAG: hypothetical protein K6T91_03375 [Firmicutes bacterium]|nr:hypothetical protein [Bacillota bacterium]
MTYGRNSEKNLAAQSMDLVSHTEHKLTEIITAIIRENREVFLKGGYMLEADIERSYAKSSYESEVYVLLRHEGDIVELYPIQVALALHDEEPVIFVDSGRLADLEREIRAEIDRWASEYLAT